MNIFVFLEIQTNNLTVSGGKYNFDFKKKLNVIIT